MFFSSMTRSLCLSAVLSLLAFSGVALAAAESPPRSTGYDGLADLLEDDQSRSQLIEELRRLAQPAGEAIADEPDVAEPGLAARLADMTQAFAQQMVSEFTSSLEAVTELTRSETPLLSADFIATVVNLSLLIVLTVGVFLLLRRLARGVFARLSAWAQREAASSALLRRGAAVLGAVLVDVLVIMLAWVSGYVFALFVLGESGAMDERESLFLNAFLAVEVFKTLIRALFASRDDGLRLLPMGAEEAAYWNAWLARLSGFIGYGMLLVVPIVNLSLSLALGRLAALVIMLVAFLYALVIILQNRHRVAENLHQRGRDSDVAFKRVLLGMLARSWHVVAIAYFAALGLVTLLRPEDALPFMLQATLQTLLAIGGGVFLGVVLSEIINRQLRLPEETRLRFPSLEGRLNSYIPTALKLMRLFILVAVVLLVLDAWAMFSLANWLASDAGLATLGKIITVLLIVFFAVVVWVALASWIEQRLSAEMGGETASAREKTLLNIFRSAAAVALSVMTVMMLLAEIGINIGPLIAGAGVLGLAIGFGGQKLVQDIITGVFIQLENAINAGDIVTAGGTTGTVEKLTIRSLGIRDLSGTYHIIPFSSVDTVSNYMREFAYHVGEYGVAYREDTDNVIVHLREAFEELKTDPELSANILGDLEVHGVTALADSSVNVRVRFKTLPGVQWSMGRAYNRLVKRHLDAAGIEIPFPHMTLYFGQDKDGSAPPANLLIQQSPPHEPKDITPVDPDNAKPNPVDKEDFDKPS